MEHAMWLCVGDGDEHAIDCFIVQAESQDN